MKRKPKSRHKVSVVTGLWLKVSPSKLAAVQRRAATIRVDPAIPFKLEMAMTGRFTGRTTDAALELKRANPALWRKLPAQLRSETSETPKERGRRLDELVERAKRQYESNLTVMEKIPPKVRALIRRSDAVGNLPFPALLESEEVLNALEPFIKVPGRRGRFPNRKTAPIVREVTGRLARGETLYRIAKSLEIPYNRLRALMSDHKIPSQK